jgi:Ran GTPase-activating protein (RanGAP) involved in mRNA processing and transport
VVKEEKSQKSKQIILARERKRKKVDELRVGFQERRRGTWQSRKLVSDYRKACTALLQLEEQAAGTATEFARPVNENTVEVQDAGKGVDKVKTEDAEAVEEDEDEEEEITEEVRIPALFNLCRLYSKCGNPQ